MDVVDVLVFHNPTTFSYKTPPLIDEGEDSPGNPCLLLSFPPSSDRKRFIRAR